MTVMMVVLVVGIAVVAAFIGVLVGWRISSRPPPPPTIRLVGVTRPENGSPITVYFSAHQLPRSGYPMLKKQQSMLRSILYAEDGSLIKATNQDVDPTQWAVGAGNSVDLEGYTTAERDAARSVDVVLNIWVETSAATHSMEVVSGRCPVRGNTNRLLLRNVESQGAALTLTVAPEIEDGEAALLLDNLAPVIPTYVLLDRGPDWGNYRVERIEPTADASELNVFATRTGGSLGSGDGVQYSMTVMARMPPQGDPDVVVPIRWVVPVRLDQEFPRSVSS